MTSPVASVSDLISVCETPRKKFLNKQLLAAHKIIDTKSKKIQTLQKVNKRLVKKNSSLKAIVNLLKKKQTLDETILIDLSKNVEVAEVFNGMYIKNKKNRKKPFSKYPSGARKFALTLHFYSPATYKYVRKMFNTCLPHPHTLYEWYRNVDAEPGFCAETLNRMEAKAKESSKKIMCALIAVEMAIRRQKIWTGKRYEGLVDMGLGSDDSNQMASQAYVFMLVAINDSWKLPLAYFFIDSLKADMKANLIKIALEKCEKIGIQIRSVTFDGCKTNIATMKKLGCEIDNAENLITNFKHPCADYNVVVFLDACHMVLMRNTFESKKILHTTDQKQIKWQFIAKLHNLQEENSLHIANKLSHRHIHFKNQIMNVKLATQLLSRSVSKALNFCEKTLKIPEFQNSDSTAGFITILNNLFDVLNTRNLNDYGFKKPLSKDNSTKILSFLSKAKDFLLSLSIKVQYKKTVKIGNESRTVITHKLVPIIKTQNNTGLLGLLTCISSLSYLFNTLVETDILSFLLTYKFSQDHVELFFGTIRSQGGHNNNPNTRQFKASLKKLLTHLKLSSKFTGNCFPLENIPILSGAPSLDKINNTSMGHRLDVTEEKNLSEAEILNDRDVQQCFEKYQKNCDELSSTLDENPTCSVISHIVGYISGFVVSKLVKKLKCNQCIDNLCATEKQLFHKLIDLRDMGGLFYASEDVFNVCMKTESVIRHFIRMSGGKSLLKKYDKNFICSIVLKLYININIFPGGDPHNHEITLLKSVIEKFTDVRIHYICKKETRAIKDTSKRQLYNKLNLFKGN